MSRPHERASAGVHGRTPFQRFGWLLWGAWMVFLVLPLSDLLASGHQWPIIALGAALLVIFVAVFTHGT